MLTGKGLETAELRQMRPGAMVFNAGHSNREIDIDWLYARPHRAMKAHIERFEVGEGFIFLLAKGSLLNLAAGSGAHGLDLFDHYNAVMLLGITWMFDGIPEGVAPGLQPFPAHLEREIAELSVRLHSTP